MCTCFWQGCAVEIGIWEKFMIAGVGVGRTFYKIVIAIKVSNFFQSFYKFYKNQKYSENDRKPRQQLVCKDYLQHWGQLKRI